MERDTSEMWPCGWMAAVACKACESWVFHDPRGLAGEVKCGVCGRRMSGPAEPVFELQSVPGWEHERSDSMGIDRWRSGEHPEDNLVEMASGRLRTTVDIHADDIDTATGVRQLITVLAMVAQELERRER